MQEHHVDQSLSRRLNQCQTWKACLGCLGLALLLALALASPALDRLVPKVPEHARETTARMRWYLYSGQLRADAHTLVAMVQYLMAPESGIPNATNLANASVAEHMF